jgi:hypothetical protein
VFSYKENLLFFLIDKLGIIFLSMIIKHIPMPDVAVQRSLYFVYMHILVEQELLTLPEHLNSPPVLSVTRSLVLCVCFVDGCLFFYTFSFGHCVVCSSSIYGF